ncbi:hypothetical protein C0J52_27805 [Blattella germanica]|nr:hypothetical protein C0J52_27805 [Blattella germanica]
MRVATLRTNVMTQTQTPQLHVQPLAHSNSPRFGFISTSASVHSVLLECLLIYVTDCICFRQHRTRPSLTHRPLHVLHKQTVAPSVEKRIQVLVD